LFALEDLDEGGVPAYTQLFGQTVLCERLSENKVSVRLASQKQYADGQTEELYSQVQYGFVWTCIGSNPQPLFDIPEYHEPDRRNVCTGVFGVEVSAPRAIENFLDMGHFPFVHTGLLGIEPHTEVVDYQVTVSDQSNEIVATECLFFQPQAAVGSVGGVVAEYVYRVPHPFCAILYKSCPFDQSRRDVITIFVQSESEERIRAHTLMSIVDAESSDTSIRLFQQMIFGQDKPILENQSPKKLPLDPLEEISVRADRVAVAYRKWLANCGVRYGVIPRAEAL
tara:strand:- start:257 stop:1102 length:846 start_codon:yes stop_codon:yes gene_type:complete